MVKPPASLESERLILRRWRSEDVEPFAAMNADPDVMRYFPATQTHAQTLTLIERIETGFDDRGYGLWALERRDSGEFIGFTGLNPLPTGSPHAGGVEVGWRLPKSAWGNGFATEAARLSITDGISRLGLPEIWSWSVAINEPSIAVMRRLGMRERTRSPHPQVPADHELSETVTYHLDAADWPPAA